MLDPPRTEDGGFWLFAYGSLIWRPDLPFEARHRARLTGWTRRFWQGSHDHRGLPDAPGRVVTLVADPSSHCDGIAYRVPGVHARDVLVELDHREKNGYVRRRAQVDTPVGVLDTLVYVGDPGNFAWLGDAPLAALAAQIATSVGPSGRNRDYLLELADALAGIGVDDAHVETLARAVRALPEPP